jgi:hypothetical protein
VAKGACFKARWAELVYLQDLRLMVVVMSNPLGFGPAIYCGKRKVRTPMRPAHVTAKAPVLLDPIFRWPAAQKELI